MILTEARGESASRAAPLVAVEFYGATLIASEGDSPATTLVVMKPVVEGMGLDWKGQHAKLKAHPVLSKGVEEISIPSAGGSQATTALPLTRLNFWLATIQPNKVPNPDTRARIIRYQEECADVLFAHFFGKVAEDDAAPAPNPSLSDLPQGEAHLWLTLISEARHVFGASAAKELWANSPLPHPVTTDKPANGVGRTVTPAEAEAIRAEYHSGKTTIRALAAKHVLSRMCVWRIVKGETYRAGTETGEAFH
ncbi:phage antirepressor N-terminal domain-containing protein [Azospirillum himalayense]|uniref:Phage antirepressor N-terminal domain-containing protein n=1 Tax=Azospirillum himalayense TaxID=654847 RepID=A0ABW0GDD3_9PROT